MAELAITLLKPTSSSPSKPRRIQVSEAVQEGDFGYLNGTKYSLCNNATNIAAAATVMFLNSAATDGYAYIHEGGIIDISVTTVKGEIYVIASTDGQCEPHSEAVSGEYVTPVFTGSGTSVINFNPTPSGYDKA